MLLYKGGFDGTQRRDDVLRFSPEEEVWQTTGMRLATPTSSHAAILVHECPSGEVWGGEVVRDRVLTLHHIYSALSTADRQ